jgi:hypothetical protein
VTGLSKTTFFNNLYPKKARMVRYPVKIKKWEALDRTKDLANDLDLPIVTEHLRGKQKGK